MRVSAFNAYAFIINCMNKTNNAVTSQISIDRNTEIKPGALEKKITIDNIIKNGSK